MVADQKPTDNSASTGQTPKSGGSPWDDDLDVVNVEPKKAPTVIGSLDQKVEQEKNPVPFNVPEEVIEDKVGKKIPADEVMGGGKPQFYAPTQSVPASAPETRPEVDQPIAIIEQPEVHVAPPATVASPAKPESANLSQNSMPNTLDSSPKMPVKEAGVAELLNSNVASSEMADPFADPFKKPSLAMASAQPVQNSQPSIAPAASLHSLGSEAKESAPINLIDDKTINKKIDSIGPLASQPVAKDLGTKLSPDMEAKSEPEVVAAPQKLDQMPEAKKSFSLFNLGRNDKASDKTQLIDADPNTGKSDLVDANKNTPELSKAAKQKKPFRMSPKLSIISSVLLFLAALIYLTEIGLLSLGLENAYGLFGMEKLWGGLPRNAETALGMAVSNQKTHLSFKYSGTISVTVDKTKKSNVSSPLVSYGHEIMPLTDINVAAGQAAVLSQYDYYSDSYDDYSDASDAADETDSSSSLDSTVDSTASSTSDATDSTVPSDTDTSSVDSSSGYLDGQDSASTYVPEKTTIKQLDFEVEGQSNEEAASSSLTLKQLVGNNKLIELVNSNGNLYVNSEEIDFGQSQANGKWLKYNFPQLSQGNALNDFFSLDTASGFSVIGRRSGNEKIDGVRSYKYKIDNLELGDSLTSIGVPQESVDSITGNIWVGVRDHLIHQVSLEIIPSISAGFTRIQVDLRFSSYDITNQISVPALNNVIEASAQNEAESGAATEPVVVPQAAPTVEPSPEPSQTVGARWSNDAQRHTDLTMIAAALRSYKASRGAYPVSRDFQNINASNSSVAKSLTPAFLSAMPNDPKAAESWWYGYKSDGKTFTLSARFENINDAEVTKLGSVYLHYVKN